MGKVDLTTVLALAMCGLTLLSLSGVYLGMWLALNLKSIFAKFFWGVVGLLFSIVFMSASNTAFVLFGLPDMATAVLTVVAACLLFVALVAPCAEMDKLGADGKAPVVAPTK